MSVTPQPPEGSVLDRRTLNRSLLARQHLLRRANLPVAEMIEHLIGLQAQVPRDPYLSLWSRLADFRPATLEGLLLEREAVRMTLMRTTLHLVTARDAPGLRAVLQGVCERAFASSQFRRQIDAVDLHALLATGTTFVANRPSTMPELGAVLSERWPAADRTALAYAVRYLVPLVQVPPRGLFRRSAAPRVTTLDAWLGDSAPPALGDNARLAARLDEVVLRYLRAFGPATGADVRAWSGLSDVRSVVERLRPRLRSYRDDAGRELFDIEDGPFAASDAPAPVRFTGEYDNVFLAHADRSRITGDLAWGVPFLRKGAFFVDGFLAGTWRLVKGKDRTSVSLGALRPLTSSECDETTAEAAALLGFLMPDAATSGVVWTSASAST